jgi:hypothetical protein
MKIQGSSGDDRSCFSLCGGCDLTAMKADFIFFMTIAAISFSGLLFTLWELAQLERGNTWTVKSIAWLMTQVWFGNKKSLFELGAVVLISASH